MHAFIYTDTSSTHQHRAEQHQVEMRWSNVLCALIILHIIEPAVSSSIQMRWRGKRLVARSRVSIWFSNELKCGFIFRTGTPLRGNTPTTTTHSSIRSGFHISNAYVLDCALVQVSHSNFRNPLVCSTIWRLSSIKTATTTTVCIDRNYNSTSKIDRRKMEGKYGGGNQDIPTGEMMKKREKKKGDVIITPPPPSTIISPPGWMDGWRRRPSTRSFQMEFSFLRT